VNQRFAAPREIDLACAEQLEFVEQRDVGVPWEAGLALYSLAVPLFEIGGMKPADNAVLVACVCEIDLYRSGTDERLVVTQVACDLKS